MLRLSLYTGETECLDQSAARVGVDAVLRFLAHIECCAVQSGPGQPCRTLREEVLEDVLSTRGGLLVCQTRPGDKVSKDDMLAQIQDPCTGQMLEELRAQGEGTVFFVHRPSLINGHDVASRILPEACGV